MKAFLVCFLLISALLFPSCVSARELVQNEMMSVKASNQLPGTNKPGSNCGSTNRGAKCKIYPKPNPCSKQKGSGCRPPGSRY